MLSIMFSLMVECGPGITDSVELLNYWVGKKVKVTYTLVQALKICTGRKAHR